DWRHCGRCHAACSSEAGREQTCVEGHCVPLCDDALTLCSGSCVDLSKDPAHCGACGVRCESRAGARGTCSDGECMASCAPGLSECDDGCVELASDPKNCGACGAACASDEVCSDGVCSSD